VCGILGSLSDQGEIRYLVLSRILLFLAAWLSLVSTDRCKNRLDYCFQLTFKAVRVPTDRRGVVMGPARDSITARRRNRAILHAMGAFQTLFNLVPNMLRLE